MIEEDIVTYTKRFLFFRHVDTEVSLYLVVMSNVDDFFEVRIEALIGVTTNSRWTLKYLRRYSEQEDLEAYLMSLVDSNPSNVQYYLGDTFLILVRKFTGIVENVFD